MLHGTDSTFDVLYLPLRNYNGATVAGALNAVFNGMPGSYYLSASFDINTNQLNIYTNSADTGFLIYPDYHLKYGEKWRMEWSIL